MGWPYKGRLLYCDILVLISGETATTNYAPQNDFSMYNQAGVQSEQRQSISSGGTMSSHADTDDEESLNQSQKGDFDYFGAATTQQVPTSIMFKIIIITVMMIM